ncbi:MAG TPA: hypothetical protein VNC50_00080, partial [Planctomycetia bacterium]|nr:hypothetical protein [Planctomycetia bacterium]
MLLAASTGCGEANNQKPLSKRAVAAAPIADAYCPKPGDPESARAADVAILFFGNSHTGGVPERVRSMLRLLEPKKSVYVQAENVGWLEGAANDPRIVKLLQGEPWKAVVLQAQRLSSSGRHQYSRTDGIALAKAAKARGARVLYYSEWGLEGVDGDARHNERVYQLMAEASGAEVAPVGRAWDAALAADPKLPLFADDGNHQSGAGMFLTSCTLAGAIAGKSPAALAEFADESVAKPERKLLAETAATTLKEMKTPAARPLPKPTGPFAVGTGTLALVDPKRDEVAPSFALAPGADPKPMAAAGKRTVEVFLWYPAEQGPRPGESSLYNRDLEFLAQLTKDASIMEAHRA